jgi:hypothetical protein
VEDEFLGVRMKRFLDCAEGVITLAVESLSFGQVRQIIRNP